MRGAAVAVVHEFPEHYAATFPREAAAAPKMIQLLLEQNLDIVNGVRVSQKKEAYRPGHRFGNWLLTTLVARMFGQRTTDMLTGYRVFSRRFVRSFPALTAGFEIETEIIVHALELRVLMQDYPTQYGERPTGSASKLNTIRDGVRILRTIGILIKEERPFTFFFALGAILLVVATVIFIPVFLEYLETGLVRRFPTAILAVGMVLETAKLETESRTKNEPMRALLWSALEMFART